MARKSVEVATLRLAWDGEVLRAYMEGSPPFPRPGRNAKYSMPQRLIMLAAEIARVGSVRASRGESQDDFEMQVLSGLGAGKEAKNG